MTRTMEPGTRRRTKRESPRWAARIAADLGSVRPATVEADLANPTGCIARAERLLRALAVAGEWTRLELALARLETAARGTPPALTAELVVTAASEDATEDAATARHLAAPTDRPARAALASALRREIAVKQRLLAALEASA